MGTHYQDYHHTNPTYNNNYPDYSANSYANNYQYYENFNYDYNYANGQYFDHNSSYYYHTSPASAPVHPVNEHHFVARHQPQDMIVEALPPWEKALSTPSIVSKILTHSSMGSLKSQRKVCNLWNKEAKRILARSRITFRDHSSIRKYIVRMGGCRDFIGSFLFGPNIRLDSPISMKFLEKFGPHINFLELHCSVVHVHFLNKILLGLTHLEGLVLPVNISGSVEKSCPTVLLHLPKLKSLGLIRRPCPPEELSTIVSFFKDILSAAPNLEEIAAIGEPFDEMEMNKMEIDDLSISSGIDFPPSPLDDLLWSILLQGKDKVFLPFLKNVKFQLRLSPCVQYNKIFPLTSMDLIIAPNTSNKMFQDFLENFKATLVQLRIKYCGGRAENEADLPITSTFPTLKKISLEGYEGNLCFLERMRSMEELVLRKVNLNKVVLKDAKVTTQQSSSPFQGINFRLRNLQVFKDSSNNFGSNRQRSIQTIQRLGIMFPSIRSLRLERLVDESLCLIYAQWPKLEELELKGIFTDAGTTSIHPNAYKVIRREEAYNSFNVDALRLGLFLGDLSMLKRLKIDSPNISDVTIILGLLSCPNLQNLWIESAQITDTALYRVLETPTITSLTTKRCEKLSCNAIEYVSTRLQNRGGTPQLNKVDHGPFNAFGVVRFLEENPKSKVLLKRLKPSVQKLEPKNEKPLKSFGELPSPPKPKKLEMKLRLRKSRALRQSQPSRVDNSKSKLAELCDQNGAEPLILKPRPLRKCESIFRRFKEYALY